MVKNLNLKSLSSVLKINFKDEGLLKRAFIHRSYLNEHRKENLVSNERLEFLGDAVLELWSTGRLFYHFPNLPEGVLTNIRAAIVCMESLARISTKLNLGKYLFLSKGEENGGGRKNQSLLADTFEAVLGAIYLDRGWNTAATFLDNYLLKELIALGKKGDIKDAKTKLQEKIQAMMKITPDYKVVKEKGPDHNKIFTSAVYFNKKKVAQGTGLSKREAEESAAKKALTIIKKDSNIQDDVKG